jgi:hypothetical protein
MTTTTHLPPPQGPTPDQDPSLVPPEQKVPPPDLAAVLVSLVHVPGHAVVLGEEAMETSVILIVTCYHILPTVNRS